MLVMIVVAVFLAAGLVVWFAITKRRSQDLREKFGTEYDYTMEKTGDWRTTEDMLLEREKRVQELAVQALASDKVDLYRAEWDEVQAEFVDRPAEAVKKADLLITEVMIARGFPVEDFEQRAADLSVLFPDFVRNYRSAHAIAQAAQQGEISTEDLRQAMVYYRSLFEELLKTEEIVDKEALIAWMKSA
jgi:hypothetical protein